MAAFESPKLLTARRHMGFVDIPEDAIEDTSLDLMPTAALKVNRRSILQKSPEPMPGPTSLKRMATMSGNIVSFDDSNVAYWLARKVEETHDHGITRLGYRLRPKVTDEFKSSNKAWELDIDESCLHPIVTIKMVDTKVLDECSYDNRSGHSPLNELSYLQTVGNNDPFVDGTGAIATCSKEVYAVLPYHRDGTLEEYCRFQGNLPEELARCFFCQILQGMQTLQKLAILHRDLSLGSIGLDGNRVSITESRFPLRCKKGPQGEESPPVPGGHSIQYIAPEYFRPPTGPWDGFAADLWAVGLMLYGMVAGCDALFLAPVVDDRTFVKLCVKGKFQSHASKYGKLIGKSIDLSDELVDLLQKMLKVDPNERLKLEEILEHPWVTKGEILTPEEWTEKKMADKATMPTIADEEY